MPYRTTILTNDQIYHVFNRGVAGQPIFSSRREYSRFLESVEYYRFVGTPVSFSRLLKIELEQRGKILRELQQKNLLNIEILAFCLMPNHFHFLLKQTTENGLKVFMANIQNGLAKYFNTKRDRSGPLFQSTFRAVRIETDEQLLHVSRYIHLNPSTSYLVSIEKLMEYPWSSLPTYTSSRDFGFGFVKCDAILSLSKNKDTYKQFVMDNAEYQRELGIIKHLIIE